MLWNQCGGYKATFPPMTIYDNLYLGNRSFGFYINTTKPDTWEIVSGGWAEDKHGANCECSLFLAQDSVRGPDTVICRRP